MSLFASNLQTTLEKIKLCLNSCTQFILFQPRICKNYWNRIKELCRLLRALLADIEFEKTPTQLETILMDLTRLAAIKSCFIEEGYVNFDILEFDDLLKVEFSLKVDTLKLINSTCLYHHFQDDIFKTRPEKIAGEDLNETKEWDELLKNRSSTIENIAYAYSVASVPALEKLIFLFFISKDDLQDSFKEAAKLYKSFNGNKFLLSLCESDGDIDRMKSVFKQYFINLKHNHFYQKNCSLTASHLVKDGKSGQFILGTYKSNPVILKKININISEVQAEKEIRLMKTLISCANLIKVYGYVVEDSTRYLVIEWFQNGNLFSFLREKQQLSDKVKLDLTIGITNGLMVLHKLSIIHHSLKSPSIYVRNDLSVAIADFDLMNNKSGLMCRSSGGNSSKFNSLYWRAPETIIIDSIYSEKSDIYSLGVVIWEIFSDEVPFQAEQDSSIIIEWIKEGKLPGALSIVGNNIDKVIEDCWAYSADDRPLTERVLQILKEIRNLLNEPLEQVSKKIKYDYDINRSLSKSSIYDTIDLNDKGCNLFHIALKNQELNFANALYNHKKSIINSRQANGWTALHFAASMGFNDGVNWLLDRGAFIDLLDENKRAPLHVSASNGHLNTMKLLLGKPRNLNNFLDISENNILQCATENGHYDLVSHLLDNKMLNIDHCNARGDTALHIAAERGYLNIVKLLFSNGADTTIKSIEGKTAYVSALEAGHLYISIWLENRRTKEFVRTLDNDWTYLHIAAEEGSLESIRFLTKYDCRTDKRTSKGTRPIHIAIANGYVEVVNYLLKFETSSGEFNEETFNPFHVAISLGSLESLKLLYSKNIWKITSCCFNLALRHGNMDILNFLHERFDYKVQNTLVHIKSVHKSPEVLHYLRKVMQYGLTVMTERGGTLCHIYASVGDLGLFINSSSGKSNVELKVKDADGNSCLHISAINGYQNLVQWLVMRCSLDVEDRGDLDRNVLHCAVISGNLSLVKWLVLNRCMGIDAIDKDGNTVLHLAIINRRLMVFKWLAARKGVNLKLVNKAKKTLLHLVAEMGYFDILKLCVETYSLDINALDVDGNTAIDYAMRIGHYDILTWLIFGPGKTRVKVAPPWMHIAAKGGNLKIVEWLFNRWRNELSQIDENGELPFQVALRLGHTKISRFLLTKQRPIQKILKKIDKSILYDAIKDGELVFVKWLINGGMIVKCFEEDGYKAINTALQHNQVDIAKEIIVDLNFPLAASNAGQTGLHRAIMDSNLTLVKELVSFNSASLIKPDAMGITPIYLALRHRFYAIWAWMVEERTSSISHIDNFQRSLLHYCASEGNIKATEWLLNEVNLSFCSQDKEGNTAIHLAVKHNRIDYIRWCLETKKVAKWKFKKGRTVAHIAAAQGNLEVLKLLEEFGIDLNAADAYGDTVGTIAESKGFTSILDAYKMTKIYVISPLLKAIELKMLASFKVQQLKEEIAKDFPVAAIYQYDLKHDGLVLSDQKTIAFYKIKYGSYLEVELRNDYYYKLW